MNILKTIKSVLFSPKTNDKSKTILRKYCKENRYLKLEVYNDNEITYFKIHRKRNKTLAFMTYAVNEDMCRKQLEKANKKYKILTEIEDEYNGVSRK